MSKNYSGNFYSTAGQNSTVHYGDNINSYYQLNGKDVPRNQILNSDIDGYTTDELEELVPQLEKENSQGHESIRRVLTVLKKRQDERKAEKKQKNKEDNERQRLEDIRTNGFSLIVDPDSTFDSCEYCDGDPHDSATPCGCHCH